MVTRLFLRNTNTGKEFEVIGRDAEAGTITLKGDYGTFTETYDKDRFLAMGYERVKKEVAEAPVQEDEDAE